MSTSSLDIRIILHSINISTVKVHVLAIPVLEQHTGEVIFEFYCKALDVLCPGWKDIIIGISTDGKRKVNGCASEVACRFQRVAKANFIRIWCGAHLLNIRLQDSYTHCANQEIYRSLTSVMGDICGQQNVIGDMRSKLLKVEDTNRESISLGSG